MKTIVIDGKEYQLVPVVPSIPEEVEDVLGGYELPEDEVKKEYEGVRKAVGKVSGYRERYKKRALRRSDLTAPHPEIDIPPTPTVEFDRIEKQLGERVFFGPGLTID